MRRPLPVLLVSLLLALQSSQAAAQAGRVEPAPAGATPAPGAASGRAVRTDRPPLLDGRDDDPAWRGAPAIDDFRQFSPAEDGEPSFRTEVRAT